MTGEWGGRRVTLVWLRRRFVCHNCGERHLEEHPEFGGNLTRRLVADAKAMSISAVSRREGLGRHKIMVLVSSWSEFVAEIAAAGGAGCYWLTRPRSGGDTAM